ncbi:BspA family leucine-rich repeat surface protein [Companilactobacillus zhachilii]|uniref:BspA family leucine-rich repeat surface protein n=1 Tax=Companilactobacillus zhachilii TaxID=2304606 RepID=UPI0019249640|nr:BspA family leucine-rich repeat surface protein [Companilactobacillus zhachilii]MBL3531352.1 BspA family leucine-rich repeat surface protein [Companilactobacillus zhachilii]
MMRFQQLMRKSNAVLKKKMYKSGKNWIVKYTLSLAGGLALFGVSQSTVVKAEVLNGTTQIEVQDSEQTTDTSVTDGSSQVAKDQSVTPVTKDNIESNPQTKMDQEEPQPYLKDSGSDKQSISSADIPVQKEEQSGSQGNDSQGQTEQKEQVVTNQDAEPTEGMVAGIHWRVENLPKPDGTAAFNKALILEPGQMDEIDGDPWGSVGNYLRNNITLINIDTTKFDFGDETARLRTGKSISGLFKNFVKLERINDFNYIDADNLENLSNLFQGCKNFKYADLSDFAPKNAKDVSSMFEGDSALENIDISGLSFKNIDNVTDMFKGVSNLEALTLPSDAKLRGTGLTLGQRDDINQDIGNLGWFAYRKGIDNDTSSMVKDTPDLISLYEAGNVEKIFTWKNYTPLAITIIGQDTNGKQLGTSTVYVPIDHAPTQSSISNFFKNFERFNSNDSFISNDSISDSGSRVYVNNKDGVSTLSEGSGTDSQGNKFMPISKELLQGKSFEDFLNEQKVTFSQNGVEPYDSGVKAYVYAIYKAKDVLDSSSGSSSSGNSSVNKDIEGIEETIATYAEKPDVQLYDDNGSSITDRKLAPNSDWFTDELMQLNKDKFYRVATNQWAKADDVYLYYPNESKVRVNSGSIARLVTDEGKAVTDRALQPLSNWYTDKYIYINDVKYYRVATNEFVSANDVTEY